MPSQYSTKIAVHRPKGLEALLLSSPCTPSLGFFVGSPAVPAGTGPHCLEEPSHCFERPRQLLSSKHHPPPLKWILKFLASAPTPGRM